MDVVSAYRNVGSYRGAAQICGADAKTVKPKVLAWEAGELDDRRARHRPVAKNTDVVRDLVAKRVDDTKGKVTAKRLLVEARAVGYVGSDRNFRRLVSSEKKAWRAENAYQRRPGVWTPGEMLVIDWGTIPGSGIKVFCAVLAWSRFRFVGFARDETAASTFAKAVAKALERAVRFGRFRADDIASILAIGPIPDAVEPGEQVVVVDLPPVEVRSFDAYRIGDLA